MTEVVNIRKQEFDIYIGRGNYCGFTGIWGNPHNIGYCELCDKEHSREEAISEYKIYFYDKIKNDEEFKRETEKLKNKRIGCYCSPLKCHGDVIKEYLDKDMKKYRVAVIGSRDYNNFDEIFKYLDSKIDKISSLVSGGCPSGADNACQIYAKNKGISITIHYPDWSIGKGAGFIRNRKIVEDAEIIIAFTTGSKGTQNSIDLANKLHKKVIIHRVEPDKK